jgi:hypothetical protein
MEFSKTVITVAGLLYLGLIGLALGGIAVATIVTLLSNVWKKTTKKG